jgi:O-methyltransferase
MVECGVLNGGTAAILSHFATHSRIDRTVWLFDSFEGMPQVTEKDDPEAQAYVGQVIADIKKVRSVLKLVDADMSRVRIIRGWFHETFPKANISKIALLHIDADWYESVRLCLEAFYNAVVTGGFIAIDDYGHWSGCKKAVDKFFAERGLSYKLHSVDYTARWFQKV